MMHGDASVRLCVCVCVCVCVYVCEIARLRERECVCVCVCVCVCGHTRSGKWPLSYLIMYVVFMAPGICAHDAARIYAVAEIRVFYG
jgi:hypothetical protein